MGNDLFNKLLLVSLALYCITLAVTIGIQSEEYQWDFRVYYYAAKAYAAGLNPYDQNALAQVAHTPVGLPYTYPPATLLLFYLFTFVELNTAFWLFLTVKCVLLIGLIYLWKKNFLKTGEDPLFYPFCFLAFNSAVCVDILAGNITILEQFCIWVGFHFFMKNRLILFCVFVLLGSVFRLTPVVFLVLLWYSNAKRKDLYFLFSLVIFVSTLLVSYSMNPAHFSDFLTTVSGLDERGFVNPSTLPLTKDLLEIIADRMGVTIVPGVEWIVYSTIVVGIVLVTWRAYRAAGSGVVKDREHLKVFLMCLVYALVLPRFKDYSYISLVVPTFSMLMKIRFSKTYFLLFLLSILPTRQLSSLWPGMDFGPLWEYHVLLLAYLVWGMYVYRLFSMGKGKRQDTLLPGS
jgi:hypothetical protein